MAARVGRLKRRADFLRVADLRRRCAAPGLVLQAAPIPDGDAATALRVGFTASRKVGGAVERNRARRRLKAAVAIVMPDHAAAGLDYVVIGRQSTLDRGFADLVRDLETALRRLDLWRDAIGAAPMTKAGARTKAR
jgi:ribonuclease P protein component